MKYWDVAERFLEFKPVRYGWIAREYYRDEVFVEDGVAKYMLHWTVIAEFDGEWLTLRTEGWNTMLTFSRINAILNAARLRMSAWRDVDYPTLRDWQNKYLYPFLDNVKISLENRTIVLPEDIMGDVRRLNEEVAEASYRIKAKALHILARKGYEEAIRYARRAIKIGENARERMNELSGVYGSAREDIVRYRGFVITVVRMNGSEYLIAAGPSRVAGKPMIYAEPLKMPQYRHTIGNMAVLSKIVAGNAEPVEDVHELIIKLTKAGEKDKKAFKFLAAINAHIPMEARAKALVALV